MFFGLSQHTLVLYTITALLRISPAAPIPQIGGIPRFSIGFLIGRGVRGGTTRRFRLLPERVLVVLRSGFVRPRRDR